MIIQQFVISNMFKGGYRMKSNISKWSLVMDPFKLLLNWFTYLPFSTGSAPHMSPTLASHPWVSSSLTSPVYWTCLNSSHYLLHPHITSIVLMSHLTSTYANWHCSHITPMDLLILSHRSYISCLSWSHLLPDAHLCFDYVSTDASLSDALL